MLSQIYTELAEVFDSPLDIDRHAKSALLEAGRADLPHLNQEGINLDQCFVDIMTAKDAHPICTLLMDTPFWIGRRLKFLMIQSASKFR